MDCNEGRVNANGNKKIWGWSRLVTEMFFILIGRLLYRYIHMLKLTELYILNGYIFLYISYISIKLTKKYLETVKVFFGQRSGSHL